MWFVQSHLVSGRQKQNQVSRGLECCFTCNIFHTSDTPNVWLWV